MEKGLRFAEEDPGLCQAPASAEHAAPLFQQPRSGGFCFDFPGEIESLEIDMDSRAFTEAKRLGRVIDCKRFLFLPKSSLKSLLEWISPICDVINRCVVSLQVQYSTTGLFVVKPNTVVKVPTSIWSMKNLC